MADFPTCYAFVLPNEDDTPPRYAAIADPTETDPGAQAISGINSAAFPARFAAIAALAQAARGPAVESFYLTTYWNGWIRQLQNAIAMRVMDAEVNHGDSIGVLLLQRACNALGPGILATDGRWGPLTLDAALSEDVVNLVHLFQAARVSFLRTAALTNPIVARDLPQLVARASK
jgi:lysozyme family protein